MGTTARARSSPEPERISAGLGYRYNDRLRQFKQVLPTTVSFNVSPVCLMEPTSSTSRQAHYGGSRVVPGISCYWFSLGVVTGRVQRWAGPGARRDVWWMLGSSGRSVSVVIKFERNGRTARCEYAFVLRVLSVSARTYGQLCSPKPRTTPHIDYARTNSLLRPKHRGNASKLP